MTNEPGFHSIIDDVLHRDVMLIPPEHAGEALGLPEPTRTLKLQIAEPRSISLDRLHELVKSLRPMQPHHEVDMVRHDREGMEFFNLLLKLHQSVEDDRSHTLLPQPMKALWLVKQGFVLRKAPSIVLAAMFGNGALEVERHKVWGVIWPILRKLADRILRVRFHACEYTNNSKGSLSAALRGDKLKGVFTLTSSS